MIVDGQFDEARQGIKQATKLHKQFSRAKFLQAKLELAEGHMDAAIEGLMELVVSEPRLSVELIPVLKNAFERSSKHSASPQQSEAAWSVVIHRASSSVSAADALAVALIVHGVLQFESVKTLIRAYVERDALLGGLLGAFKLSANQWDESTVAQVSQVVKRQAMKQSRYRCGECGFSSRLFFWQCPGCRQWDAWVSLSPTEA
jgi:lipopolysaccharide biosynthesis regulator YciM